VHYARNHILAQREMRQANLPVSTGHRGQSPVFQNTRQALFRPACFLLRQSPCRSRRDKFNIKKSIHDAFIKRIPDQA